MELSSRERLNLTIFAHFPLFFIKKRSNLTMFSLPRLASLEHPFQASFQWLRHLSIMKISSILLKPILVLRVKGSCIDLILRNRKYSFKNTSSTDTSLSDHHHLISSMTKTVFEKEEPEIFNTLGYKKFALSNFKSQLLAKHNHGNVNYLSFENKFVNVLNKHSPKKTKVFLW